MSNSIWKTPEENPDAYKGFACYKSNLSLIENNRYLQNGAVKPDREWGYVKEIIAQADKAERLQKAVDIAKEALKYARQRGLDNTATLFAVGTKADKALDEIRQLIKEKTNDK